MSDAPAGDNAPRREEAAAKHEETVAVDSKPVETKPAEAKAAEATTRDDRTRRDGYRRNRCEKSEEVTVVATATNDTPKVEAKAKRRQKSARRRTPPRPKSAKPEVAKPEIARPEIAKPELAKTEAARSGQSQPRPSLKTRPNPKTRQDPTTRPRRPALQPTRRRIQARLPDADKPRRSQSPSRRSAPARSRCSSAARIPSSTCGRTSRRCSTCPITIAPSDRPLGTHVFTAEIDKNDANVLHWSVVSLPVSARSLAARRGRARLAPPRQDRGRGRRSK